MIHGIKSPCAVLLCLLSFVPGRVVAGADEPGRAARDSSGVLPKPQIFVRWTDKKVTVDGVLDEQAWKDAAPYESRFYQMQPLDRAPSSEKTRVMVLQDAKKLYFGVQCFDSEPEKIFASSMRRDMNYGSGEVLELLLDTFRDNRNCYAFDTNPLGGKGDAIISDQGSHINKPWECVIDMDGAVNPLGWAAEFAVPFKSLKYVQGDSVDWNINITREIKHRQEETYLAPIPRALGHSAKFRGELFGLLRGIKPPKRGLHFEIAPYLLAGRTRLNASDPGEKGEFRGGADFKYDLTTRLALDLTFKTDFAQAESEEEIVNVTRFNILRQEKRDFFLQNAGYFQFGPGQRAQPYFMLFDSRTVGIEGNRRLPLQGGGKMTGRWGPYSIGALSLWGEEEAPGGGGDAPSVNYTAVRVKRDVSQNSHLGLVALNRQSAPDLYSRVFGLDGLWNVSPTVRLDASAARSFSPVPPGGGFAGDAGIVLNKEWLDVTLRHTVIDSAFQPAMGFVRRPDIRSTDAAVAFTRWVNGRRVQNVALTSGLSYLTDPRGALQTREQSLTGSLLSTRGDEVRVGFARLHEFVPRPTRIRDIEINAGLYDGWAGSLTVNTYRARRVNAAFSAQWGRQLGGRQRSAGLAGTAKASDHLSVDLAYSYARLDLARGGLAAHVLSTRWTYSFTPDLFAKTYVQWNSADRHFSVNFLADYAYRPKSHLYLVVNESLDTQMRQANDRILLLKWSYLFQI